MVINKWKEWIYIDWDKVDCFSLFERHIEIVKDWKKTKKLYPYKVFINWFQRVDKTRIINHWFRDTKYSWAKLLINN